MKYYTLLKKGDEEKIFKEIKKSIKKMDLKIPHHYLVSLIVQKLVVG